MKNIRLTAFMLLALSAFLAGCVERRGMLGDIYISTARPAISLSVPSLPLITAGRGITNMTWTGMAGGLPINVWLAVYGQGGLAPMAIVAQAQTPEGWYWDATMYASFSVDQSVEGFNGVSYQGCTFIANPANDPFANLYTAVKADGSPLLWLVRSYAARYNFDNDKIIMQYREPLPEGITSLTDIPYGKANYLAEFRQRAREAFEVADCPANPQGVKSSFANAVSWQFMNQNFLGTVSKSIKIMNWD